MKKIGLVGGTGPESTLMYYKELNSRIDRLTGEKSMPDIAIESVDFRRAWNYVCENQYDKLSDYLAEKVNNLLRVGCEVISLTAVTMHVVLEEIEKKIAVSSDTEGYTGNADSTRTVAAATTSEAAANSGSAQLVSIPKAVSEELVARGFKKVGLLGTIFTMEQDYMKKDLISAGIQVVVPQKQERELVAKRIFEELEKGIVKESTLKEFVSIINKMAERDGIEGIILGCTELPLLLNSENCPVACFDAVELHIKKLIQLAM